MRNPRNHARALRAAASVVRGKRSTASAAAGLLLLGAGGCNVEEVAPLDGSTTDDVVSAMADATPVSDTRSTPTPDSALNADTRAPMDSQGPTDTVQTETDTNETMDIALPDIAMPDAGTEDANTADLGMPDIAVGDVSVTDTIIAPITCPESCYEATDIPCATMDDCPDPLGSHECYEGLCQMNQMQSPVAEACCMDFYTNMGNLPDCMIPEGCTPWGPAAPPAWDGTTLA